VLPTGCLHVVATPIGNLDDLSPRALKCLAEADLICAEDTRHTQQLLAAKGLKRPLLALHEHNEAAQVDSVLSRLRAGEQIALVSDAGTPLISDPGFRLVCAVRAAGFRVSPLPGPCAAIAALLPETILLGSHWQAEVALRLNRDDAVGQNEAMASSAGKREYLCLHRTKLDGHRGDHHGLRHGVGVRGRK